MRNFFRLYLFLLFLIPRICGAQPDYLAEGIAQEAMFRNAVSREIQALQDQLREIEPSEALRTSCLKQLEEDLTLVQILEGTLKSLAADDNPDKGITWSLKTNKLAVIIPLTITLITENFPSLMNGSLVDQYMAELTTITYTPPKTAGQMHGASGATALKNALFIVLRLTKNFVPKINESAFFHTTPLIPLRGFEGCSYFFKDEKSPQHGELLFPHSGYAFGGMRGESRHQNKTFGPQDCSSWVRSICSIPVDFSTMHLLFLWENRGQDNWLDSDAARVLRGRLKPITVAGTSDIKPGYLYVHRSYNLDQDPSMSGSGNGGHTGIVHDIDPISETVIILQYGRDMPKQEGFGLWETKALSVPSRKTFYFEVNEPRCTLDNNSAADHPAQELSDTAP